MKKVKNILILPQKLAEICGVSEREIRRLANDGIMKRKEVGKYDLAESLKGYINFIKNKNSKVDDDLKRARKEKVDIETLKLKGELIDIKEVEEFHIQLIATIRTKLLSLPKKLVVDLKDVAETIEKEKIIKKLIYEVLEDLENEASEEEGT